MPSLEGRIRGVRRVCIIGGGPSGVAAAKYLLAENDKFQVIDVYEQRDTIGGVWNYTSSDGISQDKIPVPSTKPSHELEVPTWVNASNGHSEDTKRYPVFVSPLYDRLEANLPKMMMQYSDMDFPEKAQLYPTRTDIFEYLERYTDSVRHLIHTMRQVTRVSPVDQTDSQTAWNVQYLDLRTQEVLEKQYDAVIVNSGHHEDCFIPDIQGIAAWEDTYPHSIRHSKHFRRPEDYTSKSILVVGHGPSGSDIAHQLSGYAKKLHISTRSPVPSFFLAGHSTPPTLHSHITSFDADSHTIHFNDSSTAKDIDIVLFCTGYLYSHPFLCNTSHTQGDGSYVPGLFHHFLSHHFSTLAFLALPKALVPFPVAELQAAVVARLWVGRLAMPSQEEMEDWEKKRGEEYGHGAGFHRFGKLEDVTEMRFLADWAAKADGEDSGVGKKPPYWGKWEEWLRARVPEVKMAFVLKGEERRDVTTLEQLGFIWEGPDR